MFVTDGGMSQKMARVVDRKLTLSYQSLLVLQRHGFNMGETLGRGVSYLNREELRDVRTEVLEDKTYERTDPSSVGGTSAKEFYADLAERLRNRVEAQPTTVSPRSPTVADISENGELILLPKKAVYRVFDPRGGALRRSTRGLVYQLVREEFPTCRCWCDIDNWAMNTKIRDEERERKVRCRPGLA
jgi:hypothetical protein